MNVVCPRCGATNRVPEDRLRDEPVCGKCGAAVLAATPQPLDDASLAHFIERSEPPVLIDFWAEWCGPCKTFGPQFAQAAAQRPDLRFVKVDSDASPLASSRHGIRSIPTVLLYAGGHEVARLSGAVSSAQLLAWADQALARERQAG